MRQFLDRRIPSNITGIGGHWRFEDNGLDISGNGNHLTIQIYLKIGLSHLRRKKPVNRP